MSSKVKIITDSASDLLPEEAKKYDIEVIPFSIFIDGKEYKTGIDLLSEDFYKLQKTCKEVPTTSLVAPEVIYDTFKKYVVEGREILLITISSKGSGFYNSARLASEMIADEYPDAKIKILDTQKFAYVYAYGAIEAAKMAEQGMELDEIYEKTKELISDFEVYAVPESLVYLEKGGRINKASLIFGSALDLKPMISIRDGLIESVGMLRGTKKIPQKLIKKIKETGISQEGKTVIVVNGDMDETTQEFIELVKAELNPGEILVKPIGPTIATHVGPVFGIFFHLS